MSRPAFSHWGAVKLKKNTSDPFPQGWMFRRNGPVSFSMTSAGNAQVLPLTYSGFTTMYRGRNASLRRTLAAKITGAFSMSGFPNLWCAFPRSLYSLRKSAKCSSRRHLWTKLRRLCPQPNRPLISEAVQHWTFWAIPSTAKRCGAGQDGFDPLKVGDFRPHIGQMRIGLFLDLGARS